MREKCEFLMRLKYAFLSASKMRILDSFKMRYDTHPMRILKCALNAYLKMRIFKCILHAHLQMHFYMRIGKKWYYKLVKQFQLDCKFMISPLDDSISPRKIQFISKKIMIIHDC